MSDSELEENCGPEENCEPEVLPLCIAEVISLNKCDTDVDPIRTGYSFTNVIMRKDECTFPFRVLHDRSDFARRLKNPKVYRKMVDTRRIDNFFKCMARDCMFSSEKPEDFIGHVHWHSREYLEPIASQPVPEHRTQPDINDCDALTVPDFYMCTYCPAVEASVERLVKHATEMHAECLFQCSGCFFRARSSKIVEVHIAIEHPIPQQMYVIHCPSSIDSTGRPNPQQMKAGDISMYRCSAVHCQSACVLQDNFATHMSESHAQVEGITSLRLL